MFFRNEFFDLFLKFSQLSISRSAKNITILKLKNDFDTKALEGVCIK